MRILRFGRRLGAFLRAPLARKRLALEAARELIRARILTLGAAQAYTREFGSPARAGAPQQAVLVTAAQEQTAAEIGQMAAAVARCLPIRALCLQQAIAVRRMLGRRGIPATVSLGIALDRRDREPTAGDRAAHAWVTVGSRVISGHEGLENYAAVARFA